MPPDLSPYKYLHRRAIVPHKALSDVKTEASDLPVIDNVQGDVYFIFPKVSS